MLGRGNLGGRAIIVQRQEVFPAANGGAGYQQTHGSETVVAPSEEEKGGRANGGNYLLPSASGCEGDK